MTFETFGWTCKFHLLYFIQGLSAIKAPKELSIPHNQAVGHGDLFISRRSPLSILT